MAIGSFVTSIPCCNVEIQGYKITEIQGYKTVDIQGYKTVEIKGYKNRGN
jgi:hypothetical protein